MGRGDDALGRAPVRPVMPGFVRRTRLVRRLALVGVAVCLLCTDPSAGAAVGPATSSSADSPLATHLTTHDDLGGGAAPGVADPTTPRSRLERGTGLVVTIDSVKPATLQAGENLTIKGTIDNSGERHFSNAKVYLDMGVDPATSRATLAEFAQSTGGFGDRVVDIGHFDELGGLAPGSRTNYRLQVPFGLLPISREPGIYHVGVTVIAGAAARAPVARADTLIPLLPDDRAEDLEPTGVVTLIPMAAQIRRTASGVFLDDDLAGRIAFGGQLRNLLDFVAAAPSNSLEVVLDPALRQAVEDMADGYQVRTLAEYTSGEPGHAGQGQADAEKWLADLDAAVQRQDLLFMAWSSPDASALGSNRMTGVVGAAVRASQRYAGDQAITTTVASWPFQGACTRRGLAVAALSGAPLRIVSQRSLVNLRGQPDGDYPPSQVLVPTAAGQTTALVTRTDVAGDVIAPELTGEQLAQDIVAEATVRALDSEPAATSVIAVPFGWDPGNAIRSKDLDEAYGFPTVHPLTAASAVQETAVPYKGRIRMPRIVATLSDSVIDAVTALRNKGRVYAELLTDQEQATRRYDQTLAEAGTSLWRNDSVTRVSVTEQAADQAARRTNRVRVTGPTFLALSSGSGRFPLTVTNGLPNPVTVRVVVRADNPAVRVDPIDDLALEPGQHRDLEATARTDGSGITTVRIGLTTTSGRAVGRPWNFDIRSTQIGLAIWIVMGVVVAILFGAAGRRIYQRIRSGTMQPREEPSP